jgi:hypothetical protein
MEVHKKVLSAQCSVLSSQFSVMSFVPVVHTKH